MLLTTPTKDQLAALEQLSRLPRWTAVDGLLTAEIDAALERLLGAKVDADLHELRGIIKAFKAFQKAVAQATDTLAKQGQTGPM